MDIFDFSRGVIENDINVFAYLHSFAYVKQIIILENCSVELSELTAYGVAFKNTVVYDGIGFAHIKFDCQDSLIAIVLNRFLDASKVLIKH